jgi:hypothetical protein
MTPVLLVPGTTLTPDDNFRDNYAAVFTAAGRPWCSVELPKKATGDIQVAAEYVVYAIRAMHAKAGRKISVVGVSQGGVVPRWALKYWPDTRLMVDDLVGLVPDNHGTLLLNGVCAVACPAAFWQQRQGSRFMRTLNDGAETYAGISYTQMYSATDPVVIPSIGPAPSAALTTGDGAIRNVLLQDICPLHVVADHILVGSVDPVAHALVMDALNRSGPADPNSLPRSV